MEKPMNAKTGSYLEDSAMVVSVLPHPTLSGSLF